MITKPTTPPTMNFDKLPSKTISPTKLAHIVLRTPQMPALATFYTTFLGAHIVHSNPSITFLTYDSEHHRLAIINMPNLPPKSLKSAGLEHFAFTFPTLTDLLMAYRQRKAAGITPIWCVNHGPTISLYYRDPDGNVIETQYDVFGDGNEAVEKFLESEEFRSNPIGVDVDPEELIGRLQGGEEEREVVKRPNIGGRELPDIDEMW